MPSARNFRHGFKPMTVHGAQVTGVRTDEPGEKTKILQGFGVRSSQVSMKIGGDIPAPASVIIFGEKSQKCVVIITVVSESATRLKALHPKKLPHINGGRGN